MTQKQTDVVFATRSEWIAFVKMLNAPLSRAEPHRNEERSPLQFEVILMMEEDGQSVRRRLTVLNVSNGGLMLKGETELESGTAVVVEIQADEEPFHVVGMVRHCTQTLGGFKIGVKLKFA